MAKKYDYLFDNASGSLMDNVLAKSQEASTEMKAMIAAWEKHQANTGKMVMGESKFFGKKFAEALKIGESKNGFPQLQIGEGKTHLGLNTIAGINALRSMASGKYSKLVWHYHAAWFDPRRDAEGIVAAFIDGEWHFFDWRNGSYQESRRMGKFEYLNRVHKHEEIDKLLQSLEYGSAYTLVFNRDLELSLFQERIQDSLEKSCSDVWEEIAQEYAEAAAKSSMLRGDNTRNTAVKVNPDRLVVDGVDLTKLTTKAEITYTIPSSTRPVVILFDPASEQAKVVLNNLLHAPPAYQIVGVKEVA